MKSILFYVQFFTSVPFEVDVISKTPPIRLTDVFFANLVYLMKEGCYLVVDRGESKGNKLTPPQATHGSDARICAR